MIDQTYTPPPAPVAGRPWPGPTRTAYPLKPWDKVLSDGQLVSGALGHVKAVQHEQRVVVEWRDERWVVARPRLFALPPQRMPSMSTVFRPKPKQWGLRGDPYVWEAMRHLLEASSEPGNTSDAIQRLDDAFRRVVGVSVDDSTAGETIRIEAFDHGGMSGGWVDLNTWRTKLMPLLKSRLAAG